MDDAINKFIEKLGDTKICVGLEQQGHIPTIEKMLENDATWDEIGKKINWCAETAKTHYQWYVEEQRKYDEAHKEYFESLDEIEKEKSEFLDKIKACVKPEHYQNILDEIEESENTGNYRIVDRPEGDPQYNKEFGYTTWIYQRCGACGDDYYGTICVKLPNDKYFIWNFAM